MSNLDERYERGKALRKEYPRSTHAIFERAPDVDPVQILLSQDVGRLEKLVPIRHQRMAEDSFAFYRAGAKLMATDLANTTTTGLMVQASGDAHLSNFGWYGSPERHLVFDTNDFDETHLGSFEWDVKRLATSFALAARSNGFDGADAEEVTRHCVQEYRDAMLQFASLGVLDVWYAQLSADRLLDDVRKSGSKKHVKRIEKGISKARSKDSQHVLGKLAEKDGDSYRIKEDYPWVIPVRTLGHLVDPDTARSTANAGWINYLETLPHHTRVLARRFEMIDVALKVVGVGSVGTRCWIILFQGRDEEDPLFLQMKEAGASVLEETFGASRYPLPGQRVVEGQKLMQTSSDIFLGWITSTLSGHNYYIRQLKDMKYSAEIEDFGPNRLKRYGSACAWTLAQCHARSGDPAMLAGYIGSGDVFADSITQFAFAYAAQNDADYAAFMEQVIEPEEGEAG